MSLSTRRAGQRKIAHGYVGAKPQQRRYTAPGGLSLIIVGASILACSPESLEGTVDPWEEPTGGNVSSDATTAPGITNTLAPTATGAASSAHSGTSAPVTTSGETPTSVSSVDQTTSSAPEPTCTTPEPGRSPLRRLTRFEYSNTLESLLTDTSDAGQDLPAELLGNGFGNDADDQPASAFLIEQYSNVAIDVVGRVENATWANYDACVDAAAPNEQECARSFVGKFARAAYRRPLDDAEMEELLSLQQALREHGDFKSSITGTVEAILQSPDFLYRLEFGELDANGIKRPSGAEMANRLSFFLWGGPPDEQLNEAAANGELSTPNGVMSQAERLLEDPKSRRVVQFFFDNLLPVNGLTDQTRDPESFPTFNPGIGALMAEETTRFLQHAVFEDNGTWDSILTAPYTFVNEELANFYGIPGVTGEDFRKVDVDPSKRLGLLSHASVLTGTTVTNYTNPVRRGGFLLSHILCVDVPLPPDELAALVKPPEPYSGATGRERYSAHSSQEVCRSCHTLLDPPGFAFENYDAVGLWRDTENDVTIDASGELAALGSFSGPLELVQLVSKSELTHKCFTHQWQKFAYGRDLDDKSTDKCSSQQLDQAFASSGHSVKQMLLDITQTDAFLYLGAQQ